MTRKQPPHLGNGWGEKAGHAPSNKAELPDGPALPGNKALADDAALADNAVMPESVSSHDSASLPEWVVQTVHPSWLTTLSVVSEQLWGIDKILASLEQTAHKQPPPETSGLEQSTPREPQQMLDLSLPEQPAASATIPYLPAKPDIFNALCIGVDEVRVVIIGQDPYPTPGHPIGLSFATHPQIRPLPRSLNNIYTELRDDLNVETPDHGDLSPWCKQGIMLLNRVLTVQPRAPGSHQRIGWEEVTEVILQALVAREQPLVVILWGNQARSLAPMFNGHEQIAVIESAHPSPLSARRGFFGSKPFSRTNEALVQMGAQPVDWRL